LLRDLVRRATRDYLADLASQVRRVWRENPESQDFPEDLVQKETTVFPERQVQMELLVGLELLGCQD